jgi:endoglucanase
MSSAGRRVRFVDELEYGIRTLEADPHVVVYVDAGAADALTWQTAAADLREAGVQYAQGFFLNATHFDWTTAELAYGQKISKALGGAHFVINTGENGRGPLRSANIEQDGMEVLCNPPGRGLGPWSTSTGYKGADAFIWMSSPGSSGGACGPGEPPTGAFWTAYAVSLVQNAAYTITGPAERLIHLGHFIPEQP